MSVRSSQSVTVTFTTSNPSTQAAANADSTPTGTLYLNGASNAATVTVTNLATGLYKAAVTLPTLAVGDVVELQISATVSSVAGKAIVWRDSKDIALTSSGATGIDWANVQNPTTTVNLSGTTTSVVGTASGIGTDGITSGSLAASAANEIAAAVFDLATTGHTTSGTFGAAVVAAGSAGDPWSTSLPGAYGAGTAGAILGNNLDATVGSRASQTSVDAIAGYVDTEVAAIKAKTDNLPAGFPANFSSLGIDSSGRVRTDRVMFSGVLGDQSAGNVDNVVLPSGPAADGVLVGSRLRIYSASGEQAQERTILAWDGDGKIATLDRPMLGVLQASGNSFQVLYDNAPALDSSCKVDSYATVLGIDAGALAQFFTTNTTRTYADAVNGSVVKELAAHVSDTPGTTDLLALLTPTRAAYIDNLGAGPAALEATAQAVLADTGTDLPATLASIKAKTDNLPTDPAGLAALATAHGAGSWATATGFSTFNPATDLVALDADGLDAVVVEAGINARQALAVCLAEAAGVWSGTYPGVVAFSAAGAPGTARITATVAAGGRSAITLTPPA